MKLRESAKWIKIPVSLFNDLRFKCMIEEEYGCEAERLLIRLNLLAGQCNCGGELWVTEKLPFNASRLASQSGFSTESVEKALALLEEYDYIQINDGIISIVGWNDLQSLDELEASRAYHRQKQKEYRERQKNKNETSSSDENVNNALKHVNDKKGYIDIDKDKDKERDKDLDGDGDGDKDKDKDKDKDGDINAEASALAEEVITAFNTTTTFQKISHISKKQREAIANAIREFGLDELKKAFLSAENSEFLKGNNKQGWVAGFDWLIQPENLAKVLNGNYDSLYTPPNSSEIPPSMSSFNVDEFAGAALARGFD